MNVWTLAYWAIDWKHRKALAQSMSLRADIPPPKQTTWWRDRRDFLRKMTVVACALRAAQLRSEPLESPDVVITPPSFDETGRLEEFLFENYGVEHATVLNAGTLARPPIRRTGSALRWRCLGVALALLALLDFSSARYTYLADALLEIQIYARVANSTHRLFVFHLYSHIHYLLATYLVRHTDVQVIAIPFGCLLWSRMRLTHIPVSMGLTLDVQMEEARYLMGTEGFAPRDIRRVGGFRVYNPRESDEAASPNEGHYDIGFVSSGDWARRAADDQAWASEEIESVRQRAHAENERARLSDELLRDVVGYARSRGLTVRIYPHPYERRLIRHHDVQPPWLKYLEPGVVTWDDSDARTSDESIREAKVAVSVLSSLILYRLEDGFDQSYIYDFHADGLQLLNREALGKYARNVFSSFDELKQSLDAYFGAENE